MIRQRSPAAFKLRILPWSAYSADISTSFCGAVKYARDSKMGHLLRLCSSTLVDGIGTSVSRLTVLARRIRSAITHATEIECKPNLRDAYLNCVRISLIVALIPARPNYKPSIGSSGIHPTSAHDTHAPILILLYN